MFTSPGEIAFNIGSLSVHYYGICISVGIVVGLLVSYFICKKFYKDINPDVIFDVAIPVIIGGIIGARLYYCGLMADYYSNHLLEILQIYKGGMSIHGGIYGGLVGGLLYAENKKLPRLKLCDIFSFALITGQIIGRWGNFFNSEAFGAPCNNFLQLYIPLEKRPAEFVYFEYFHPTFLYESLLNILVLVSLFYILKKKPKDGTIFFAYLILYSVVRIFIETIRIDSAYSVMGAPIAIVVSLFLIFISIYWFLCLREV
ncbi:prolipoprotein diacylglyceryl transferase [bacterium]|nr:prolipoprotein diacylglyceryl transferase [bacterium]